MKVSMDYYTFLSRDRWDVWWFLRECDALGVDGVHIPDCDVTYPTNSLPRSDLGTRGSIRRC
jgi:tryptophan synthase alpha subunit